MSERFFRSSRLAAALLAVVVLGPELCAAPETRTILVFPFENQSSRPDLDWLAEGFAQMISSRLAGPGRYVLGRDERIAAYEELGVPTDTALTLATEFKVAETLGVDWAVVGNFTLAGDRLAARTRLLDMRHLKLKPPLEATGELADVVELQTRLAWRLLATEDPSFVTGNEEDFARQFPMIRLDAFENYMRGLLAPDRDSKVHFLQESDRLNPADHAAAFELGRYYFDQKDYAGSAQWLRKLTPSDSDYLESVFLVGVDEFFLGHEPESEKAFSLLVNQVPLAEVSNNLGVLEARRGRYAEALASFERAYDVDRADPDYAFNLGACLWYLHKYDQAAQHLEEALRSNDDDPAAHALLGAVLNKLGDAAGERRERRWLTEHEGDSGMLAVEEDILPWTRLKKHYDGRAFRLLSLAVRNAMEATLAKEPPEQHGDVHLTRGQQFLNQGRLTEAEHELTEAVTLLPGSGDAHLALGQVYELENRHSEAANELESSLKLHDSAPAHVWLARVYLALNQVDAARNQSELALVLDPGNRYAKNLIDQIGQRAAGKAAEGKP
ncbi:MAG TPA: tetratricopeptide repeat protein [Terriglobia bacterium]|nr:tetratricopeptide repeat protein [Terriglobia bacterium]